MIGDSQAAELFYGLQKNLPKEIGLSSFSTFTLQDYLNNATYKAKLAKEFIQTNNTKLLIISLYYRTLLGYLPGKGISITDDHEAYLKSTFNEIIEKALNEKLKILIIFKHPYLAYYGFNISPSKCSYRPLRITDSEKCSFNRSSLYDNNKELMLTIDTIKSIVKDYPKSKVDVFDESLLFCNEKECKIDLNGVNLYYDEAHVNNFGSDYIGKELQKKIVKMLKEN